MADKPASAGASGGLARGLAPPPAVHHHDFPRTVPGYRPEPAPPAARLPAHLRPDVRGHRHRTTSRARTRRAQGTQRARTAARTEAHRPPELPWLSWLPYLLVLGGVAAGLLVAWHGSRNAGHGAGLLGAALIAAAVARLVLPPRYAGPLSSRGKAHDVLAFATFGAGVLAVALMLP